MFEGLAIYNEGFFCLHYSGIIGFVHYYIFLKLKDLCSLLNGTIIIFSGLMWTKILTYHYQN